MAKDKKEYNREYYAAHPEIWQRNYAENADARRERARTYANERWENDPEYRANRRVRSLATIAEKICNVFQKISEKFE